MRAIFFLALPVVATMLNLMFAIVVVTVFHPRSQVAAQQPGNFGDLKIVHRPTEPEPYLTLEEEANKIIGDHAVCEDERARDENDPMLRPMPIDQHPFYKEVYVRADVATFYGEEPGSRMETKPKFNGQAGKFINLSPYRMKLFW